MSKRAFQPDPVCMSEEPNMKKSKLDKGALFRDIARICGISTDSNFLVVPDQDEKLAPVMLTQFPKDPSLLADRIHQNMDRALGTALLFVHQYLGNESELTFQSSGVRMATKMCMRSTSPPTEDEFVGRTLLADVFWQFLIVDAEWALREEHHKKPVFELVLKIVREHHLLRQAVAQNPQALDEIGHMRLQALQKFWRRWMQGMVPHGFRFRSLWDSYIRKMWKADIGMDPFRWDEDWGDIVCETNSVPRYHAGKDETDWMDQMYKECRKWNTDMLSPDLNALLGDLDA